MRILTALLVLFLSLVARPCRAQDELRATYHLEPTSEDALIVPSSAFRPFHLRLQFVNPGEHTRLASKYRIESLALLPRTDGIVAVPMLSAGGVAEIVVPVMLDEELGSAELRMMDPVGGEGITVQPSRESEGR